VPEKEFEETEHKAAALRRAIELAAGADATPGRARSTETEQAGETPVGARP
jgi:hypothetical protein